MVIIKFHDGVDWFKANWIFRQLAEDIVAAFPQDGDLKTVLEQAEALGALFLDSMPATAAAETIKAIKQVAEESLQEKIPGWKKTRPEDNEGQQMYLRSMSELLDVIRQEETHN